MVKSPTLQQLIADAKREARREGILKVLIDKGSGLRLLTRDL